MRKNPSIIMEEEKNAILDNIRILTTMIEMLRDRDYQFPEKYSPDYLLNNPEELVTLPFVNNKLYNLNDTIRDDRNTPIYIHIMKDDEPFTGSKHKEVVAKEISRSLNPVFNEIRPTNKVLDEITTRVHLFIVFKANRNYNKRYEMTKFEQESFPIYNLEIWPKHRLRFNVTKHIYVGPHTRLSEEERKQYKEFFNLKNQHIQKMCWDDPVNRYYYGQPDDIYRVRRIEQGMNYRLVTRKFLSSLKTK